MCITTESLSFLTWSRAEVKSSHYPTVIQKSLNRAKISLKLKLKISTKNNNFLTKNKSDLLSSFELLVVCDVTSFT